jgi:transposase
MQVTTVGLDLAKNIFQVHGVTENGEVVFNQALRRAQLFAFFEKLPPCLVGMEACGSSHHWARQLSKLGHDVRLIPAMYVKPYVKRKRCQACLSKFHGMSSSIRAAGWPLAMASSVAFR